MGCDIHVHVEVKIDGKWLHYAAPNVDRNYKLFTKMAGVRDCTHWEIEPIADPRGLPDDISEVTKLDRLERWGADGHSDSWLGASELDVLYRWYGSQFKPDPTDMWWWTPFGVFLFGSSLNGFELYPDEYPGSLEDVRAVFWFDN